MGLIETDTLLNLINEAFATFQVPNWVENIRSELMSDAEGDPAVSVWITVKRGEEAVCDDNLRLVDVRDRIHKALRNANIELWPYVRFVSLEN